jgi:hypothetical protein
VTKLINRKSALCFQTEAEKREKGRYRKIIVVARPEYAIIRLSGLRTAYTLPWEAICDSAIKAAVRAEREAKRQKAKAK